MRLSFIEKKIRKKKQYWVHPIVSQRLLKEQFQKVSQDLRAYPKKFFNYYRMSVKGFDELLQLIRPYNTYQDTKWRKAIIQEERLSVTLRFRKKSTKACQNNISLTKYLFYVYKNYNSGKVRKIHRGRDWI